MSDHTDKPGKPAGGPAPAKAAKSYRPRTTKGAAAPGGRSSPPAVQSHNARARGRGRVARGRIGGKRNGPNR